MARTNHPIPPACGIYYYEVEILSKGQKAHVSIGFTTSNNHLNKLPGWEKGSWGYHGDDGCSFAAEKQGNPYGPTYGGGDIIGAGIDFTQHRAFFTKNGTLIGMVFHHIAEDVEVYPSVGLRHANEAVCVNFGHSPFRYDIDDHVQQQRDAVWARIQRAPIDWHVLEPGRTAAPSTARAFCVFDSDGTDEPPAAEKGKARADAPDEGREEAGRLVLNYLVHHGYAKTAHAFETQLARARARTSEAAVASSPALPVPPPLQPDVDSPMPDAEADAGAYAAPPPSASTDAALAERLAIVHAVQRGDIDGALEGARARFPEALAREQGLVLLKLRCRKFVELVNEAAELKRRVQRAEGGGAGAGVEDGAMEVDDSSSSTPVPVPASPTSASASPAKTAAETALRAAIAYGQTLRADYKRDARREVQGLLERTFGVVAYHFPMEAGGAVGKWAGQDARDALAGEVNQAILESQGWPARPALERVYRQTGACLAQLGFLGVGAAVYADMRRELLDG
ncbi:SPRY-domain-containing protein [Dentipellis sp. KUC8613]|nr:SPRY-domain-containing protein [Dentipellis sp. KUC8613]